MANSECLRYLDDDDGEAQVNPLELSECVVVNQLCPGDCCSRPIMEIITFPHPRSPCSVEVCTKPAAAQIRHAEWTLEAAPVIQATDPQTGVNRRVFFDLPLV